jgi:hypoxanthine phosphoribosyltransferase
MKEILPSSLIHNIIQNKIVPAIKRDHKYDCPVFLGVLNGSTVFLSDLIRECNFDLEIDFCRVQSYENNKKTNLELTAKWIVKLKDRVVILVDDILETGETIQNLIKIIEWEKPKDIKVCTLLKRFNCKFNPDYFGYEINNKDWCLGYGMDDDRLKRNLSGIWIK